MVMNDLNGGIFTFSLQFFHILKFPHFAIHISLKKSSSNNSMTTKYYQVKKELQEHFDHEEKDIVAEINKWLETISYVTLNKN